VRDVAAFLVKEIPLQKMDVAVKKTCFWQSLESKAAFVNVNV